MKIIRVELSKEALLSIPDLESEFFFAIGHLANEINCTTKLLYWTANWPPQQEAEEHGRFAYTLFLTRLLAGHLNEAWEFLQKSFLRSMLGRDYVKLLDLEATKDLEFIKRYFSSSNLCNKIRNELAFHFSAASLKGILPDVDDALVAYMQRDAAPNNLYYYSEILVAHALTSLMTQHKAGFTFDDLVSELFDVGATFVRVSDGLMDAIIRKNGKELRTADSVEVKFDDLLAFTEVRVPWFTNTDKVATQTSEVARHSV